MIRDCTLGDGCVANSSQLNEAVFGANVNIGPFAYVRPGTRVADNAKVGDFVEVKNAVIGEGTKLPHLIYVGDSDVGSHCNFGCGSITCNYDGNHKYRTTVGDNVFIGCNTNLVAPVTVESGAFTAAGSTITSTVPADALAVARARQVHKEGWAKDLKTPVSDRKHSLCRSRCCKILRSLSLLQKDTGRIRTCPQGKPSILCTALKTRR